MFIINTIKKLTIGTGGICGIEAVNIIGAPGADETIKVITQLIIAIVAVWGMIKDKSSEPPKDERKPKKGNNNNINNDK